MKNIRLLGMSLILLSASAIPAKAGSEDFEGSLWGTWTSRAWYANTGLFATNGSAFLLLPEISHKPTGIYGGFFISMPTQDSVGSELDVRVGKVTKLGFVDLDTRVAWYHFNAPGNVIVDVGNARAVVSHSFKLDQDTSLQPYGIFDVQRTLSPNIDTYVALAAGVGFKHAFIEEFGGPTLRANAEVWQYVATPAAVHASTVFSLMADLAFKPWNNNVSIGPRGTLGYGDIAGGHIVRASAGLVLRAAF